ncbi:MAG: hypothetical protein AB7O62_01835 [Pirellulales bacterium]
MTPNQDRDDETMLLDDREAELSVLVGRQSYQDFSELMDKHLADLVAQWSHLAAPYATRGDRVAIGRGAVPAQPWE